MSIKYNFWIECSSHLLVSITNELMKLYTISRILELHSFIMQNWWSHKTERNLIGEVLPLRIKLRDSKLVGVWCVLKPINFDICVNLCQYL